MMRKCYSCRKEIKGTALMCKECCNKELKYAVGTKV